MGARAVNEDTLTWKLACPGDALLLQSLYFYHIAVGGAYVTFHLSKKRVDFLWGHLVIGWRIRQDTS